MGEVLQFPGNRAGSEGQAEGVERRSAPSRHPSRGRRPADDGDTQGAPVTAERGLGPDQRREVEDHERDVRESRAVEEAAAAASEPRWAVPGVDDDVPVRPEPTRSSKRAENVAIAALTRHDASEGEIRAKLVAKGLDDEDVEAELDRLRRIGLIDDAAFAARLIDRLRERKGLGDQAIRSTLRGRLVPQDVIDTVLVEQAEDEDTAAERLQEVADDRARKLGSVTYAVAERRLTAYLMRKGYSGSAVRSAVRAALEGSGNR
jgi:regulatory protein